MKPHVPPPSPSASEGLTGLYIHFPFCAAKCPYCHFDSLPGQPGLYHDWWDGLKKESQKHVRENLIVDTVYLGGGTPSLLQPGDIRAVTELLEGRFWLKVKEFTLEANPDLEDLAVIGRWKEAGVTRLSIGVQSFDDRILGVLGRTYWAGQAKEFCSAARAVGFESVNFDLMIGVPGESLETAERTIEETLRLAPDHVSLYILENVEGQPFEKVLERHPVNEDVLADGYHRFRDAFAAAGIRQYEISNFAREGRECRHNLKYWRYEPFIGLGPSACSHIGMRRWCNRRGFSTWRDALNNGRPLEAEVVELTPETGLKEALVFGLRLVEGVDLVGLKERFGLDPGARFAREIEEMTAEGWLVRHGTRIRIPPEKFLLANQVFSRFV
jgi:oxygen-independent coproporphyrinogen-3 oxidase